MEQHSNNWYDWRDAGLGSSDAAVILGISPYKTRYKLWEEKCKIAKKKEGNKWAMDRGNEYEPIARATVEMKLNMDFPARLAEHPKFPFMRSSLDGYNAERSTILEIKVPGREDHEMAKSGKAPDKYFAQIQQQFFVTGATDCVYYSYWINTKNSNDRDDAIVWVKPDIPYIKKLFEECCKFWQLVQTRTPPEMVDDDFTCVRSRDVADLLQEYRVHRDFGNIEMMKAVEAKIRGHDKTAKYDRWRCGPWRVTETGISIIEATP